MTWRILHGDCLELLLEQLCVALYLELRRAGVRLAPAAERALNELLAKLRRGAA